MITKYTPSLVRMEKHMKEHPNDYQTKIQYLITRSKHWDKERKIKRDMECKTVHYYLDLAKKEKQNEKYPLN